MQNPTNDDLFGELCEVVARYPQLGWLLDALCEIDAEYDSDPVDLTLDRWHEALVYTICSLQPPPETPVLCSISAEAA